MYIETLLSTVKNDVERTTLNTGASFTQQYFSHFKISFNPQALQNRVRRQNEDIGNRQFITTEYETHAS